MPLLKLLYQPQNGCRIASETLSGSLNFQNLMLPQTPLGGLWAYAHSIIVVTINNQRSEPPPPPHTLLLPVLCPCMYTIFTNCVFIIIIHCFIAIATYFHVRYYDYNTDYIIHNEPTILIELLFFRSQHFNPLFL